MLAQYRKKRNFSRTSEPAGKASRRAGPQLVFVVQKHAATNLHYDFRLEMDGVLKSWAVPKGPSLNPARKSLAVEVEDHPIEYRDFEGSIPKGQYGGGSVLLWDRGTWEPLEDPGKGFKNGKLHFVLHGEKLKGAWMLVRFHGHEKKPKRNWLLMKSRDPFAAENGEIIENKPRSVKSHRLIEAVGNGKAVKKNATTVPTDIRPQLATWVAHPPAGDQWLHEVKLDGYPRFPVSS